MFLLSPFPMSTTNEQSFSIADAEQLQKAQDIITMVKEQDEFTTDEADEIISFIYEKLGLSTASNE